MLSIKSTYKKNCNHQLTRFRCLLSKDNCQHDHLASRWMCHACSFELQDMGTFFVQNHGSRKASTKKPRQLRKLMDDFLHSKTCVHTKIGETASAWVPFDVEVVAIQKGFYSAQCHFPVLQYCIHARLTPLPCHLLGDVLPFRFKLACWKKKVNRTSCSFKLEHRSGHFLSL